MGFTCYWKIKGINIKKLQKYIVPCGDRCYVKKVKQSKECLGVWWSAKASVLGCFPRRTTWDIDFCSKIY